MYGIKHELEFLPLMPQDGDTWSVMQSWVLPTRSFLEFVMFSRCILPLVGFSIIYDLTFCWYQKIFIIFSIYYLSLLQDVCGCLGCTNV